MEPEEKIEDLADLIRSETKMDWKLIEKALPKMPTSELIALMAELGLYVNRTIALELAGRKDVVFWLRKMIQDGGYWHCEKSGFSWSPIHAIHILALIKSNEALELLLDTIRYRGDDLGDWLTENVASLLVAFGEGAMPRLKEFTADETLEKYVRGESTSALSVLARKYPSHKDEVIEHLTKLLNKAADPTFAGFVADDLASFRDPSVLPEIHKAFEGGRVDESLITERSINAIIEGRYDTHDENDTREPLEHFSRKHIEYLHSISHKRARELEPKKEKKVGRNEPCPCGSGKKYKKCCMEVAG